MQAMMKQTWSGIAALALLLSASAATAAPMTFVFASGQIRVEASTGATVLGLSNLAQLDGSSVTIDADAGTLDDMSLTSSGPVNISLTPAYEGLDALTLTDLSLSGGPGPLNLLVAGPPDLYSYQLDPLNFAATLDATGPTTSIVGLAISTMTDGSGFISHDPAASALFLQGVTIGEFSPADLGITGSTADSLVLKADFMFVGEGVIPEPNGARLMVVGLALVALATLGHRRLTA